MAQATKAVGVAFVAIVGGIGITLWRPAPPKLAPHLSEPDRNLEGRTFLPPLPTPALKPKTAPLYGPPMPQSGVVAKSAPEVPSLSAARFEAEMESVPYVESVVPPPVREGDEVGSHGPTPAQSMSVAWLLHPVVGPPAPPSNAPAVRVRLSRPLYRIRIDPRTGAPLMPRDVNATAELVNWPAGVKKPASFSWHVALRWEFAPLPTAHSIERRTFIGPGLLAVDFGKEVRGGVLTVTAEADCEGEKVAGNAKSLMVSDNPPRDMVVKAFPKSRFGLIASKVATAESGLRQFTEPSENDPGGLPLLSPTYDVGIMQLNAPTGSIASAEEVWDWRANVLRGLGMLGVKRRTTLLASRHSPGRSSPVLPTTPPYALLYLNIMRELLGRTSVLPPPAPPLSFAPGSGLLPGEADPDKLALSQIERDMIRRYNGGCEYRCDVEFNPETLEVTACRWLVDPTRGGIHPKSGALDYVTRVLNAHSGLVLPPEKQPVKKSRRRVR